MNKFYKLTAQSLTIRDEVLVDVGKLNECLKFINNEFLSELETAMTGVIEELAAFEGECK